MNEALNELLRKYRASAKSEREKGSYFERLTLAYLKNDPLQVAQFEDVWPYAEWAGEQGFDRRDTGIDLVAKLRDSDGFCAIQCKFYRAEGKIQKSDIDSFISASGKAIFKRRLIIDTTDLPWSELADAELRSQSIETNRIGLVELSESPIDWSIFLRDDKIVLAPKKKLLRHQSESRRRSQARASMYLCSCRRFPLCRKRSVNGPSMRA